MHFKEAGKRVFNIWLGNTVVIKKVDIVRMVGPLVALDEYIEFEFKNNMVVFEGKLC